MMKHNINFWPLTTDHRPLALVASLLFLCAFTAGNATHAGTVERFPPPQFTVEYEKPVEKFEPPTRGADDLFSLGVFAAALGIMTILVFTVRKRWVIMVFAGMMLLLYGFLRKGCVCAPGAIQNITEAAVNEYILLPYFVIGVFALPILVAFFFGRTFCAGVCPMGAAQELMALRPQKVPHAVEHTLGIFPYIYLGFTVFLVVTGTMFLICKHDPYVVLFRAAGNPGMVWFLVAMLVLGVFVARPYCRYMCPYGALLRLASCVSRWNIRTSSAGCENCHLCADACPYGAILPPTVPPSDRDHVRGRYRLGMLLCVTPFLLVLGYACGGMLGLGISGMHPLVQRDTIMAKLASAEEAASAENQKTATQESTSPHRTDTSAWTQRAVEFQGISPEKIHEDALRAKTKFYYAGKWLGAWITLVFCAKLIQSTVRRRRTEYTIDTSRCVCCGRCFEFCPNDRTRTCPKNGECANR